MVKENTGRTISHKRQMLFCGIVVLCVLVGGSLSRSAVEKPGVELSRTKKKKKKRTSKKSSTIPKVPPKLKRNTDGYRMCVLDDLEYGQEPLKLTRVDAPLPIRYQCAGHAYEDFGAKLQALVREKASGSTTWAQRTQPIPSKFLEQPRHILFFGSSHLRQVLAALMCQYNDQVLSVKRIQGATKYSLNSFSLRIVLQQNIYIHAVINPPFIYAPEWQRFLEHHVLQMPLEIMDLVVTSHFHGYSEKHAQPYLEFLQDNEGTEAETATVNQDPPSFLDLTQVYEGRMIYVGLFAEYGDGYLELVEDQIQALAEGKTPPPDDYKTGETHEVDWEFAQQAAQQPAHAISKQAESMFTYKAPPPKIHGGHKRRRRLEEEDDDEEEDAEWEQDEAGEEGEEEDEDVEEPQSQEEEDGVELRINLRAVDGRRYVEDLGECSTDTHKSVHTCITDPENERYSQGHRCFGDKGGHADLIAYDLVEAMHEVLLLKQHPKRQ